MRIWDGRIKDGKIELKDREGFHALIQSLEGKEVQLTLERFRMRRSNQQSRYYWGVIVALLADHCGYEPEEMHEALKAKFLRDRANEEVGDLPKIRSSASLDTVAFSDYCAKCQQLAAELGLYVPSPNEF